MVKHICPICSKKFNKKSSYNDHVNNKKKPCKQNAIITPKNAELTPEVAELTPEVAEIGDNQVEKMLEVVVKLIKVAENIPKKSEKIEKINENNDTVYETINLKNEKNNLKTDDLSSENINKKNNISCFYCGFNFARKDNLTKHIKKSCKVKKLEDEKKQNIFDNLVLQENNRLREENNRLHKKYVKDIKKLKLELENKFKSELDKKNKELDNKINIVKKNIQNITNNNNNTQNITNNINITPYKINPFGKETFDKLEKKEILKVMTNIRNNGKFCFNKLIDLIHFNNNIPENQNVYMGDFNRGKFMIHDGSGWNLNQNEEYVIFEVLEHVRELFNEYDDEEFEDKLHNDKKFRDNFNITFKKYFDYIYDEAEDAQLNENELLKKQNFKKLMESEVKNRLYNKRQIPIDSYEKLRELTVSNISNINRLL